MILCSEPPCNVEIILGGNTPTVVRNLWGALPNPVHYVNQDSQGIGSSNPENGVLTRTRTEHTPILIDNGNCFFQEAC